MGQEPDCEPAELLDRPDALFAKIADDGLVVLRGTGVSGADELHQLGMSLGTLFHESAFEPVVMPSGLPPGVNELTFPPDREPATALWHSDYTLAHAPPRFLLLTCVVIPDTGGDTEWLDMRKVLRRLPAPLCKELAKPRLARHSAEIAFARALGRLDPQTREEFLERAGVIWHPVISSQGAKRWLFVNGLFCTEIDGDTSGELLRECLHHIENSPVTFRHSWLPGDLAIWDNRFMQHRTVDDFRPAERLLRRVCLADRW